MPNRLSRLLLFFSLVGVVSPPLTLAVVVLSMLCVGVNEWVVDQSCESLDVEELPADE